MGIPPKRRSRIFPKLLITRTPIVYPPIFWGSFREEVPIPPAKSQVIIPVPPPTQPSSTIPLDAFSSAS